MKAPVEPQTRRVAAGTGSSPAENHFNRYALYLVLAALVLLTLVSYRHIATNGFVFDDGFYLVQNRHVQQGLDAESLKWAFTAFYGANWQPLTWLSSMLDYQLYGPNPVGHHATNLLFHLANTVLLLLVFRRMTGSLWKSAFVAAVFALHPLHVESVAWASERKDVLSTFFMLATIWAYSRYAESPSLHGYVLAAFAFALGLMAKPMLVSLPILLLLLDFWPLRRTTLTGGSLSLRKLLWEKTPLFALSLASCIVTYLAQKSGGAVVELEKFPVALRVANAAVSYAAYIWRTVWPMGLAAYYPYPREGVPALTLAIALLVMTAVSVLVIRQARSRPYLLVGWLWYVITLVPVIGIVQVGEQSMADRYMYIPLIGLTVMAAWGAADLLQRRPARQATMGLSGVSAVALLAFVLTTSAQVRYWQSDYTLFRRVVEVAPGSALAYSNYGLELAKRGDHSGAIEQYEKAIQADPNYVQSYVNLGNALKETGKPEEALEQYRKALDINPNYADAQVAAANIAAEHGDADAALQEYTKVLESDPDNAEAHYNLGLVFSRQGKIDDAVKHFERAVELNPDFDKAHHNLATIALDRGETEKAADHFAEAVRVNPKHAGAHHGLARLLVAQGKADQAEAHFEQAIKAKPDFAQAHNDLGILMAQQGRIDEAMAHFADAVRHQPGYAEAHCNLALGMMSRKNLDGAIAEYRKAIDADPNNIQAQGGLAMALYNAGRFAEAWRQVQVAESHGAKLPPDFLKALSTKIPAEMAD